MSTIIHRICNITWALWFGGIIALLIFVQTLFKTDRDMAIAAAPHLFLAFEAYQLGLGAVVIATAIPRWKRKPGAGAMFFMIMVLLALVLSIVSTAFATPEIMWLRATGETSGPRFGMVHGISMLIYTVEALSLLLAGIVMPGVGLAQRYAIPAPAVSVE